MSRISALPFVILLTAASLALIAGCATDTRSSATGAATMSAPQTLITFVFYHPAAEKGEEFFVARTSDPKVIAAARQQLSMAPEKRNLHINGALARGDGGFNSPWRWHIRDNQWHFAQIGIELCDGVPRDIENDLDYWVDKVKRFCPWKARIMREEPRP